MVRKDMEKSPGVPWEFGDRRQELVFIGRRLKYSEIQSRLDYCLLDDEEMAMGPEKWMETMADEDEIGLYLGDEGEGEGEGEEEEERGEEGL